MLSMRFNRIGFGLERATAFAEALEVNTSLTFLDMAQNELGKIGAAAFARALAKNSTLRTLHFERNELLPEGGRALGAALAANVGLTSLNVSQNELGEGAAAFRGALARALLARLAPGIPPHARRPVAPRSSTPTSTLRRRR